MMKGCVKVTLGFVIDVAWRNVHKCDPLEMDPYGATDRRASLQSLYMESVRLLAMVPRFFTRDLAFSANPRGTVRLLEDAH